MGRDAHALRSLQEVNSTMKYLVPCLFLLSGALAPAAWGEERLLAPVQCNFGSECFVQQYPDVDPGPDARDPFCGSATYDEHNGIDFRILSMRDVEKDVPVVAVAAGEVLRVRDGEPDELVGSDEQRKRLNGRECGNGLVIAHAEGLETQLCHLKQGSISVRPGERVVAGQQVGAVGASGLAQFPHVHLSVRQHGEAIDPVTGKSLTAGCGNGMSSRDGLFVESVASHLTGDSFLLDVGLTGSPLNYERLVLDGAPPDATTGDHATVGWAWLGNLQKGDRIKMEIQGPDGAMFSSVVTEPLDRNKAVFSHFSGRSRPPVAGPYRVRMEVLRADKVVLTASEEIIVN